MSLIRVCDCPAHCHQGDDLDEAERFDIGEDFEVIAGKDICHDCLSGSNFCRYWIPRVIPEPSALVLAIGAIWDPVLKAQIQKVPLYRSVGN